MNLQPVTIDNYFAESAKHDLSALHSSDRFTWFDVYEFHNLMRQAGRHFATFYAEDESFKFEVDRSLAQINNLIFSGKITQLITA